MKAGEHQVENGRHFGLSGPAVKTTLNSTHKVKHIGQST